MQDVQGFPSPSPAAKPGCHDSDEVSHYLKEDDDMTAFCNRCDLLNGGQATHSHATQQHNMCHKLKCEVGQHSATQVLQGRKTQNTSLSEHLNYFYATFSMLTQQNTILQFDTSVLDHVSAATIHHCQSASKECFTITENIY